jgi:hypothetical protein
MKNKKRFDQKEEKAKSSPFFCGPTCVPYAFFLPLYGNMDIRSGSTILDNKIMSAERGHHVGMMCGGGSAKEGRKGTGLAAAKHTTNQPTYKVDVTDLKYSSVYSTQ